MGKGSIYVYIDLETCIYVHCNKKYIYDITLLCEYCVYYLYTHVYMSSKNPHLYFWVLYIHTIYSCIVSIILYIYIRIIVIYYVVILYMHMYICIRYKYGYTIIVCVVCLPQMF